MRDYELVFIVSPEVAEENLPATVEKVTQFVAAGGGTVTDVNQWGKRKLAYPIRNFSEGSYFVAQLKMDSKAAKTLERELRLSEEVIRHLLVRVGE
ncbi:MAG: 30S ribosomal protein S6 [Chloroflexi bacterium]|nr:30S ribosomal protein S6 [Chloroflexota bacterium]